MNDRAMIGVVLIVAGLFGLIVFSPLLTVGWSNSMWNTQNRGMVGPGMMGGMGRMGPGMMGPGMMGGHPSTTQESDIVTVIGSVEKTEVEMGMMWEMELILRDGSEVEVISPLWFLQEIGVEAGDVVTVKGVPTFVMGHEHLMPYEITINDKTYGKADAEMPVWMQAEVSGIREPYPMGPDMMGGGMMRGMMPGQTYGNYTWRGMGAMMGPMSSMMRGMMGYYSQVLAPITHENATAIAKSYLTSLDNPDLAIGEFEEYSHNFYVSVVEKSTGKGALELLIDRYTGTVSPEPQSMMWNTKYHMMGMMEGWSYDTAGVEMPITPDQAMKIAQDFLDVAYPGTKADEIVTYYGYYTIMTTLNGEHYGMLSVDGYGGNVWYHTWHGMFISEVELD